jgi:hypothetical protein
MIAFLDRCIIDQISPHHLSPSPHRAAYYVRLADLGGRIDGQIFRSPTVQTDPEKDYGTHVLRHS